MGFLLSWNTTSEPLMMSQGHLNSCWPAAWRVLQATCKQISYRAKGNKKEEKVDPFTSPPPPLSFFLVCFSPTSFERYAKQWSKRVCTKHLISVESTLLQKRWLHYGGRRRRRRKGEGEEEEEGGAHNTVAASSRIKNTAGSFPMQRSQSAEEVKCIRPVDVFTPPPHPTQGWEQTSAAIYKRLALQTEPLGRAFVQSVAAWSRPQPSEQSAAWGNTGDTHVCRVTHTLTFNRSFLFSK